MRLFSLFKKTKTEQIVEPRHDDELATRECTTGFEQLQQGRQDLALASFDRALLANPGHFDALQLRGVVALQRGDLNAAIAFMQRAVAANPADAGVRSNLGLALDGVGRLEEAIASFQEAIRLQPDYCGAYINSSLARRKLGQLDAALSDLISANSLAPPSADVKSSLGDVYQQRGQYDDARRAYLEALALNPQLFGARVNLSQTLIELGDATGSLQQLDAALSLNPSSFEAHLNRALALFKLRRFAESRASSERAIQLNPGNALAHANYGATLEEDLEIEAAQAAYGTALQLDPDNASFHVNKGILLLLTGKLSAGWREYDWRWKDPYWLKDKPRFNQPRWTGEQTVQGKSILVHNDQGLGDVMQFSRYIPMLVAAGARVTLEVPGPLVGLLGRMETVATCLKVGEQRPSFDLHTTFSDLPLAFDTMLDSIPAPTRFVLDPRRVDNWTRRLAPALRPRIGLVWRGNPKHKNDANRSIALELLLPILNDKVEFISLLNDFAENDLHQVAGAHQIRDFSKELIDFEETAALCSMMDMVITVDTSVAHLAGSLGIKTCILLPYLPDWRWLLNRNDSPWYPKVTLFRQTNPGNWQHVLQKLSEQVKDLASARSTGALPTS